MGLRNVLAGIVLLTITIGVATGDTHTIRHAIEAGDLQAVKDILRADPALAKAVNPATGERPVHLAAWHGRGEIGELLLVHGAKLDIFIVAGLGMEDRLKALLNTDPSLSKSR